MKVKDPQFVISAVSPAQYPESDLLEIAFAGRSNVGKSSLINALLGRKRLAYHGSKQGMTRQINYYNIDNEIHFVDLPGYGFANVSKGEKNLWAKVIENYLNVRKQLYLLVMIVDIRHKPSQDDIQMYNWIKDTGINHIIVANKVDKVNRTEVPSKIKVIRETLEVYEGAKIMPVSVLNKKGIDNLWAEIDSYIMEEE